MTLPLGEWSINVSGRNLILNIVGISETGNLDRTSTLDGSPIQGFWDHRTQKLVFSRPVPGAPSQVFTGYHFIDGLEDPTDPSRTTLALSFDHTLAGSFQSVSGPPARILRGWFAKKTVTMAFDLLRKSG